MKYRVEFTKGNAKRYQDFEDADIMNIWIAINNAVQQGEEATDSVKYDFPYKNPPREGDKIILNTDTEQIEFDTIEEAKSAASKLPDDEGFTIVLQSTTGGNSLYAEARPSIKRNKDVTIRNM